MQLTNRKKLFLQSVIGILFIVIPEIIVHYFEISDTVIDFMRGAGAGIITVSIINLVRLKKRTSK